ncbi:MAG: hypothetical protein KDD14_11375 [Saprospiraceae bacterium]|nr:hypothetical protein [Saprospiraceae bacterium]
MEEVNLEMLAVVEMRIMVAAAAVGMQVKVVMEALNISIHQMPQPRKQMELEV